MLAATCFLFAIGLFSQTTIEEVWTDMRPVNGTSEWTMQGNGLPLPAYVVFALDNKGEMIASFPRGGSFEPKIGRGIEPNGTPTSQAATQKKEMLSSYVVFTIDYKPVPSQSTNASSGEQWTMSFSIQQEAWKGQFSGTLSEEGKTISGTISSDGKQVPVEMWRKK